MNAPIRHHFLPEFYLKQWTQEDGRLVEYKIPYGTIVKPKRTYPKATGFISRLYAVEGLSDDVAHELESKFLSPVDSRAAEALVAMQEGREFSTRQRLAWASFVATLLSRMPDDIELIKDNIRELAETLLPALRPVYDYLKPDGEVRSFEQLAEELIERSKERSIDFVRRLMSNDQLVRGIAAMEWSILTLPQAKRTLLTSDRPVIYTTTLGNDLSHMALPVGPRRLFVAAKTRTLVSQIRSAGQDELVSATNAHVVGAASNYVYGFDDSQLRFVQNRMGKAKVPTIIERLRDMQREQYGGLLRGIAEQISAELDG